jgi:uncharacterized repeat protein (TIGR01451 family)
MLVAALAFTAIAAHAADPFSDVSITQSVSASPVAGKDITYTLTIANTGQLPATNVVATDKVPPGTTFIFTSPGCTLGGGTVTCPIGNMAAATTVQRRLIVRTDAPANLVNDVAVSAAEVDSVPGNNTNRLVVAVGPSATGSIRQRWRLYSPVTLEHHFTTDLNEYVVLGAQVGTWVQEGQSGRVLDNPGSYNGVAAVPYYRLYNTTTRQHHWTTDPNEYYTLILFPQYRAEGVDGYLFPTQAPDTIPLYRLLYPFATPVPGLHHWTIDPAEYNALIASFGWVGEGGSGFVIP